MVKKILLLSLLLPVFAGCMSMQGKPRVVIMQNPDTMDFYSCEVSLYGFDKHYLDNDKCVEEYKKKGYIVWGTR